MTILPNLERQLVQACAGAGVAAPGVPVPRARRLAGRLVVAMIVAATVALAVGAVLVLHGRGTSSPKPPPTAAAPGVTVRRALLVDGIGGVRFGASPVTVVHAVDRLVHLRAGRLTRWGASNGNGLCGFDHAVTWLWTVDRGPRTHVIDSLMAFFGAGRFLGYSYGAFGSLGPPRSPRHGVVLETARGLGIGQTLAHGRRLYGRAFAISPAQGGSWSVRTTGGSLVGYAWGTPPRGSPYGDVSWRSLVETIDAGNVGCPARTP